jgi:GNAT superfamily N-acetyltransferase
VKDAVVSAHRIRTAGPADAAAIAGLLRRVGWFSHFEEESPDEVERRVARHLELALGDNSHSLYVAEMDGRLAGYGAVHWQPTLFLPGPEAYVSELFVDPDDRGQGVGHALLDVIAAEAHGRGCSRLVLFNGRDRESYRRGFYTKAGWEEHPELALFMRRLAD